MLRQPVRRIDGRRVEAPCSILGCDRHGEGLPIEIASNGVLPEPIGMAGRLFSRRLHCSLPILPSPRIGRTSWGCE